MGLGLETVKAEGQGQERTFPRYVGLHQQDFIRGLLFSFDGCVGSFGSIESATICSPHGSKFSGCGIFWSLASVNLPTVLSTYSSPIILCIISDARLRNI